MWPTRVPAPSSQGKLHRHSLRTRSRRSAITARVVSHFSAKAEVRNVRANPRWRCMIVHGASPEPRTWRRTGFIGYGGWSAGKGGLPRALGMFHAARLLRWRRVIAIIYRQAACPSSDLRGFRGVDASSRSIRRGRAGPKRQVLWS